MSASKVYFTDMRCPVGTGLLDKLKKLIEKAGIDSIDMDSKFVAIKIHFGEPGNLSFLRPNFAKVVADKVTSLGGRPFLIPFIRRVPVVGHAKGTARAIIRVSSED